MDLETISKESGVTLEELKTLESTLRKKYSNIMLPPEQIEKYIEGGIKQQTNKVKNLDLQKFFGVILTVSSPKDGIAKRRATAISKYVENSEDSIRLGYVQEYKNGCKKSLSKGVITTIQISDDKIPKTAVYLPDQKAWVVPLDDVEMWKSGKKNFGYLKPLPLEKYQTHIEGLCSIDGTEWRAFKMPFVTCGEHINVPDITIPQSRLITFMSKVKTKEPLELAYNTKYTKFEPVDGDINTMTTDIVNFYNIISLSQVDEVYAARKTNYDVVSILGQISNKWIKESTDDKQYPWITAVLNDTSRIEPIKLIIHPDMSAPFEEQNIVKVWGSLSEGKKWDKELRQLTDEKEISLFVTGVFTLSNEESIPTEESRPDDGWEQ